MKYALNLDSEGRILSATYSKYGGGVEVDSLPDGDISDWLYKDGVFEFSPIEEPPAQESEPTANEILNVLLGVDG